MALASIKLDVIAARAQTFDDEMRQPDAIRSER